MMKILICLSLLCMVLVIASPSNSEEQQNKVRQTRGFKNSALATARGFGKRNSLQDFFDTSDSAVVSTAWLADQMSRNPELAQLIISKFVDVDGDGRITFSELFREL